MRYYRVDDRVLASSPDGTWDLTAGSPHIEDFASLGKAAAIADLTIDEVARRRCTDDNRIETENPPVGAAAPLVPAEVWAAGVTYRVSESAREAESTMPDMYRDVYDADRPEIFFKATPSRTVGPGEPVGIRADSAWDVPEPELGLVFIGEKIVGYTIGNDMSSREIEGANPLYLPQAKIYDRCCAIGPCVASTETVEDPLDLELSMEIERDGAVVFDDSTSTSELVRDPTELAEYYTRHNVVQTGSVLLTGTGLVPPDDFTLEAGDEVSITVEEIGTLRNVVSVV